MCSRTLFCSIFHAVLFEACPDYSDRKKFAIVLRIFCSLYPRLKRCNKLPCIDSARFHYYNFRNALRIKHTIEAIQTKKETKREGHEVSFNTLLTNQIKSSLYSRSITPKRVTSGGAITRLSAWAVLPRNVAAVARCWRHCVRFDRPGIPTPNLPHR